VIGDDVFHLAWFLGNGFGIQPWNTSRGAWNGSNALDWMKPDLYIDMTASLERAGFDYLLIEDTTSIDDTFGGSMDTTLRRGFMAPKNDPLPLVPLLTRTTKHIGIVPTISTSFYHPYTAARLMTTLDHLTEGRVGINIVTSVNHRAAQNFGYDRHHEHDLRYEMAHEWLDVTTQLWDSWDGDAVVIDEAGNRYADHTKVHPINFEGRFFKSRGPLNTIPGPQRRPVVAQAGSSAQGRALAAVHADTMLALITSVEDMKTFRDDVRVRMEECGRKPDDCKILFLVSPLIAETDELARAEQQRRQKAAWEPEQIEQALWYMSYQSGGEYDFGSFDLDAPMPQGRGNGEQSVMDAYVNGSQQKTLREVAATRQLGNVGDLVGSPDTVAAKMGEIMEYVGGDGFILYCDVTRKSISEVADGLAPALRRRGLIRSGYGYDHFRDNLLEF
jgi:FMN-dependent oxidoreductase (nitrilotriacetate monooxygenase family)